MNQTFNTNTMMRQMAITHNERWVRRNKSVFAKALLHNKKNPRFLGIVLFTTLITIAGLVIMIAPQVSLGDTAQNMLLQTVNVSDTAAQAEQAAKVNNLADSTFLLLMPAALMLCFYVAIIISKINGKLTGGKNF